MIRSCHLLLCALLAAPAGAQLPAKSAEKQLKGDIRQTLATWKGSVDTAIGSFEAAQAAFQTVAKLGGWSEESFADLFGYLNAASGTVLVATLDNAGKAEDAAAALLDDVAGPGGDLQGLLPRAFLAGGGGTWDGLRLGLQKQLARSYAGVARSLARTAAVLEKGADVRMTFRVAPPCASHEAAVNQKAVAESSSWPAFGIDLVLAASRQGVSGDGVICLGGSADPAKGKVTVTLKTASTTPGGAAQAFVFEVPATEIDDYRWALLLDGASEGNWVVSAQQGGTGAPVEACAIGVP